MRCEIVAEQSVIACDKREAFAQGSEATKIPRPDGFFYDVKLAGENK